jgi:SAM-dependent methyltransferase
VRAVAGVRTACASGIYVVLMTDDEHAAHRTSFEGPDAASAAADDSIPVSRFDEAYATGRPPWDIEGPQPDFRRLVDAGLIEGRVLDVGCGTGEHALFFAARGLDVVGVDASAMAVKRATDRACERGLSVRFVEDDVRKLAGLGDSFDTITDSGCLHTLSDEAMAETIRGAHAVLRPGGTYWLMCFNEHATGPGPRRMTRERIAQLFADGWHVKSIESAKFQLVEGDTFDDDDGSLAWLARIERR